MIKHDENGVEFRTYSIDVGRDGHEKKGKEFDELVLEYAETNNVPYDVALVEVCLSETEAYKRYEAEVKSTD